jgi:putative hydrolase of the HAD superfamily
MMQGKGLAKRMRAAAEEGLVFLDADNTLWDTDRVFAAAQLELLDASFAAFGGEIRGDPLAFVRSVDQAIAERHHDGLRYPPKLLVRGMGAALAGARAERAARIALIDPTPPIAGNEDAMVARFLSMLGETPQERGGVREGLRHLRNERISVVVLTEGSSAKARRTAETIGLDPMISRYFEGRKRVRLFERFKRLAGDGVAPFMIGDQLDRDIAPAKAAGLRTIHFPGGFTPKWTPSAGQVSPDHVVDNLLDAAHIVTRHARTAAHSPA